MDPKSVCRLCCSKDDVKHSLFVPDEDGYCLGEELRILINFEITKEDHLSERICVNCHKVNSFFKEFRKNCVEVNNYFKKLKTSEKSLPSNGSDIIIKEEKLDDYEEQSADNLESKDEDTSRNCDVPYPVALVPSSQKTNDLSQLQSNFTATKRSREEAGASLKPENQKNSNSIIPNRRAEKRRNEDSDEPVGRQRPRMEVPSEEDLLSHVVKQEEVDICDSPVENEIINNEESLGEPWSPPGSHHSLESGNVGGQSSPDIDSYSSDSSYSSDDSDDEDDNDMLMLLALLL
ncbi:uncharacterized protein [Hetaerina americana]|uniref:uncharacterized protein n=1 Tax=Hetaerina americana TaxID=62018 RepID=UPI003A7F3F11